jgi:hypothetical protein
VWSDITTLFAGTILARGGDLGGNGGNVEVSGHKNLSFYGVVDLRAPLGVAGTLLLDPEVLTIEGGLEGGGSLDDLFTSQNGIINFNDDDDIDGGNTLSVQRINEVNKNANIFLNAGQINFQNSIDIEMGLNRSISFATNSAAAGGGNNNITNVGGQAFSIETSGLGSISFFTAGTGNVDLTNVTLISALIGLNTGGSVNINVNSDTAIFGKVSGNLTLSSTGSISGSPNNTCDGRCAVDLSVGGNANLSGSSIIFGVNTTFESGSLTFNSPGAVNISSISPINIVGTNTANSLLLASIGAITDDPIMSVTVTGNASFSGSSIVLGDNPGETFNFGSLTLNSAGLVDLTVNSAVTLTGNITANSLKLTALGPISNAPNTILTVTNLASFNASSVDLGNQTGDSMNFGKLTYNSTETVNIAQDFDMIITGANTANTLVLFSTGSITDDPNTTQTVTNNASFRGTTIFLADNVGDLLNVGGTASLTSTAQTGVITVAAPGVARFFSSKLTINSFGDVNIAQGLDITLTGSNTAKNLFLFAARSIGNDPGTRALVEEKLSLNALKLINVGNQPEDFFSARELLYNIPEGTAIIDLDAPFTLGPSNAGLAVINGTVQGAISGYNNAISRSQEQVVSIVAESVALVPANIIQLDDELKRRLQISDGLGDMRIALAAVILVMDYDFTKVLAVSGPVETGPALPAFNRVGDPMQSVGGATPLNLNLRIDDGVAGFTVSAITTSVDL